MPGTADRVVPGSFSGIACCSEIPYRVPLDYCTTAGVYSEMQIDIGVQYKVPLRRRRYFGGGVTQGEI